MCEVITSKINMGLLLRHESSYIHVLLPLLILPGSQVEAGVKSRLCLRGECLSAHDTRRRQRGVMARHVAQERVLRHQPGAAAGARVA